MSPNFTCHLEMLLWIFWDYPAWVWMLVSDPQDVNPVSGVLMNCPLNPYVSLSLSESSWIVLRPKLLEFQMSVRFWIRSHFCDCMLCCWNIAKWVSILGEYVQYFQSSEKKMWDVTRSAWSEFLVCSPDVHGRFTIWIVTIALCNRHQSPKLLGNFGWFRCKFWV